MDGVIFDAHEDSAGHAYFTAEFGGTDEEVGSYQITLLRREESKVIIPILGQRAEKLGEVTFQVGSPQGPILEAVGRAKEAVEAEWTRRAHSAWQTYLEESVGNLLNLS